jgi:integration host factor subunit beta
MSDNITKRDLSHLVLQKNAAAEAGISRREVALVIDQLFDVLTESVKALHPDQRIEIRGFGTFTVKKREARKARNPKTGEIVNVEARKGVVFKIGSELKEWSRNRGK